MRLLYALYNGPLGQRKLSKRELFHEKAPHTYCAQPIVLFKYKFIITLQNKECLDVYYLTEATMAAQEGKNEACPTCMGKKIIEGRCETNSEWKGKNDDGQVCTPDNTCPTCKGKGYVED